MVGWWANGELKGLERKWSCPNRILSLQFTEGAGENREKPQNNRCPDQNSNRAPPKYKSRALPLHQPAP
jgi:hypothetical protein